MAPDPDPLSLAALIRSTRAGESAGIAGLYDRFAPVLYRTACRLAGSPADAEDVVHDLFVGLPEALRQYDEAGNFEGWIRRVAIRLTLMRLRADRRRREDSIERAAAAPSRERADTYADRADLDRALGALPEEARTLIVLRLVEGYSHDEIAGTLGISAGASRTRLNRALEQLRRAYR